MSELKLRNKETGEISGADVREDGIYVWDKLTMHSWKKSLEELAKEYEYYIEPYLKDDKIRKLVRDWATFNKIKIARIVRTEGNVSWYQITGRDEALCTWIIQIHADYSETVRGDYGGSTVPISGICGEEQE